MIKILTVEAVLGLTAIIAPILTGLYFLIQIKNSRPDRITRKELKNLESQVE